MSTPIEKIGETYRPKMMALLAAIRKEALELGFTCDEPFDMSTDDYRVTMLMQPPGMDPDEEDGMDVTITIPEALEYGDAEGPEDNGVNFSLNIVEYGGIIVGGLTPYNYSPQVWVPVVDSEAVEERWRLFDNAVDPVSVMDLIAGHYEKEAKKNASAQ
jgi:hypothetical protein